MSMLVQSLIVAGKHIAIKTPKEIFLAYAWLQTLFGCQIIEQYAVRILQRFYGILGIMQT